MRISTANAYSTGITTLQKRQGELSQAQERLTSGKRVAKASDDPAAAARAERALAGEKRAEATQRAVDASKVAMQLGESALADAGDLLQSVREAFVAAGDASYSDAERKNLAEKVKSLRDQLLTVANRTDGNGVYIFGGQGATTKPFLDQPGGVTFAGIGGTNRTDADTGLPLTIDGRAAWMATPATGNVGVFDVLDRAIGNLNTTGQSSTTIAQQTGLNIADLDKVMNQQFTVRAAAGEVLNRIDGETSRIADQKLASQTERSAAEDLDMVQALSEFQSQQTGYDAALKTYAQVQRLSLFQYLNG